MYFVPALSMVWLYNTPFCKQGLGCWCDTCVVNLDSGDAVAFGLSEGSVLFVSLLLLLVYIRSSLVTLEKIVHYFIAGVLMLNALTLSLSHFSLMVLVWK